MTQKRLQEYLNEKLVDDGIYEIYCGWKTQGAHVFCAEVTGGKIRYFDPQTGSLDVANYIPNMNGNNVGVIRIDNKIVNPKFLEMIISK